MKTYDIPQHWQVLKLRQILRPFSEKNHPELQLLSVVREKGVIIRNTESKEENHNYIPDDLSGYKRVKVGQFAMNKMKAWQGSYGVSKYEGIVSPAYFVFDIIAGMNLDFFNLAIRSKVYVSYFGRASDGIRVGQWDLSIDRMKEIPFFVPPREEQDQIVRFLDWKVSEINKIIKLQKMRMERLEEMKKTVVSKAVCPDNYPKVPFQYCAWIRARLGWRGLKAHEYVEIGYPFLSAFNIVNNHLSWDSLNFINQERYDESPEIKLSVGDILLVKDGAGIGKCARIDELPYGESTTNGSLAVITPNEKLHYRFLYYYLIGNEFKNETNIILTGMGVPHLTQHFLKSVEIPIPEYDEQVQISNILDKKCHEFDSIIAVKQQQIQALQEFKTRLISDVVTGKIDVRGIEIPEYEHIAEEVDSEYEGEDFDEQEE